MISITLLHPRTSESPKRVNVAAKPPTPTSGLRACPPLPRVQPSPVPPAVPMPVPVEVQRQNCGFSIADFVDFRGYIKHQLACPKNRVGLEGPTWYKERQQAWEEWLDLFITTEVGNLFWGEGTKKKWSYPSDSNK